MNKRSHNAIFNTHTVSGIIISIGLFVIFFAGAFSFFKEEIAVWQKGNPISNSAVTTINFDKIFDDLDKKYEMQGRDIRINFNENSDELTMGLAASKDSLASKKGKKSHFFYVNTLTSETQTYPQHYNLGEFLFRLHFLDPIPYPIGRYLAGLIAFFFMFAILTGLLIHWKQIASSFYRFNPKMAFRRIWSDAHATLGLIGLPFQFMYGLTGALFMLSLLVLIPANVLYNGNRTKLMQDLRPQMAMNYEWTGSSSQKIPSFSFFAKKATEHWKDFHLTRGDIKNYGGKNMKYLFSGELESHLRLVGKGQIVIDPYSGKTEAVKEPFQSNYVENIQSFLARLHFADFGTIALKIVYFILAFITCFVIITGVLIWIEARKKKSENTTKKSYSETVGHIYLAMCLSMLPVTALSFVFVKCTNGFFTEGKTTIYTFYFLTWLLFTLIFTLKRNNYFTNKACLLLGSIFGFLVPVSNGIFSNNWLWKSYMYQQNAIFTVDMLWVLLSITALFIYLKIKRN